MIRFNDFPVRPQSDTINAHVLAAATPETDTIPVNAQFVVIRSTGPAFYRVGAAASVPADTTNGTACEYVDVACPAVISIYDANVQGTVSAGSTSLTVNSTDGLTIGNNIVVTGAGAAGANLSTTISNIDQVNKIVTLGAAATTAVSGILVTSAPTIIGLVAAGTPTVTLSYYR